MDAPPSSVRVVVVHADEDVRRGLQVVLERHREIVVAGHAESGEAAVRHAEASAADVVLMAARLPAAAVITAGRRISDQHRAPRTLLLTSGADEVALLSATFARASGYLLRDLDPVGLQDGVVAVARGRSRFDLQRGAQVLERIRVARASRASGGRVPLTPLEDRVLDLVGDGRSDADIAAALALTPEDAGHLVARLYRRLVAGS